MTALLVLNLLIIGLVIGYWAGKLWTRLYIKRRIRSRLWEGKK